MPSYIRTLFLPLLLILTPLVFAQNPPQQFTFGDSGITVTIPEGGLLNATDDIPSVTISDMLIQMIEPEVIGVTAEDTVDAPLDDVLDYLLGLVGFDGQRASDQTFTLTLDDGREAIVFDFTNASGAAQSVMVIRLSNRQTAALNVRAAEALTGPQQNIVLAIAASFNSAGDVASAPSRADIEQAKALFEEAMETRDGGDLAASLPLFDESITLDGDDPLVLYWRGNTLKETGDVEAAIADLERAKSLDPEVVPIRTALAEVYVLADDLEAALTELDFVAEMQGSSASEGLLGEIEMYRGILDGKFIRGFYVNRAERYTKFGLYEAAIKDIETVIAAEPDNWEWHARLGNIYAAADEHREAIDAYTDALELEIRGVVFYNRAAAYQDAFATAVRTIPDAIVQTDYNYRCSLLVPDTLMTEELLESAQNRLVTIIISDDDYTPVTDPADCVP